MEIIYTYRVVMDIKGDGWFEARARDKEPVVASTPANLAGEVRRLIDDLRDCDEPVHDVWISFDPPGQLIDTEPVLVPRARRVVPITKPEQMAFWREYNK